MITDYFNLNQLFNEVIGDPVLVYLIGIVLIALLCFQQKLSYQGTFIILIAFSFILYAVNIGGLVTAIVLITVAVGTLFYYKLFKKLDKG